MTFTSFEAVDLYRQLCNRLMQDGETVVTRGLVTREILDTHLILSNPLARFTNNRIRNMDMRYLVGEFCYFLDKRTDLASILFYSKFWNHVSDDGQTVNSAYGFRVFPNQLKYVIEVLTKDIFSRKAVMVIYSVNDSKASNDNPCTINLQFVIRNMKLHCFVNMRSNDVWLGVPYDIAFFTLIQEIVYTELKKTFNTIRLGKYFHNVVSMHVYNDKYDLVRAIGEELNEPQLIAPRLTVNDTDHWFNDLITYEKAYRGVVKYKGEDIPTEFQDWCKQFLT